MLLNPLGHFGIAGTGGDEVPELVRLNPGEAKELSGQRAIELVFPHRAVEQGATLVHFSLSVTNPGAEFQNIAQLAPHFFEPLVARGRRAPHVAPVGTLVSH
jgi:hypothetical protein